jgi:hypothetical protein
VAYFSGLPLAELESIQASFVPVLTQLKQNASVNYLKIYWQTTLSLCRLTSPQSDFATDLTKNLKMPLSEFQQDKDTYGFHFYTNRL